MEKIGITIGDIAGVGPEITLKAIKSYINECVVYGSFDILDYYNSKYSYNYKLNRIDSINEFNITSVFFKHLLGLG